MDGINLKMVHFHYMIVIDLILLLHLNKIFIDVYFYEFSCKVGILSLIRDTNKIHLFLDDNPSTKSGLFFDVYSSILINLCDNIYLIGLRYSKRK